MRILILLLTFSTSLLAVDIADTIEAQLKKKLFTAIQVSVVENGKSVYSESFGFLSKRKKEAVTKSTFFDLSSLTKPLSITSMYAYFSHRGLLDLSTPIEKFLPQLKSKATLLELLQHRNGFAPYSPLFKKHKGIKSLAGKKTAVIGHIAKLKRSGDFLYSDLNYMVLGFILEKVMRKSLDKIFAEFLKEMGYTGILRYPTMRKKGERAAFSTSREWIPADPNALFLGSVSGHAGLFGSSESVARFLSLLLEKKWFRSFIEKGIGFDRPEGPLSIYGKKAESENVGHLGHSGTAFLIDWKKKRISVILTNRSHLNSSLEKINQVRRIVFDKIHDTCFSDVCPITF